MPDRYPDLLSGQIAPQGEYLRAILETLLRIEAKMAERPANATPTAPPKRRRKAG